jgi:hypothetical protein
MNGGTERPTLSAELARTLMRLRSSAGHLVLAVLFAVPSVSAQGGLTATPNPYDASAGTPLVLRNDTGAPVTFDSLQAASLQDPTFFGAALGLVYTVTGDPPGTYGFVECARPMMPCFDGEGLFGRVLAPGDEVVITGLFRYCAICRGTGSGGMTDTLRVYSGGSAEPLDIPITNIFMVASEAVPETSGLVLALSPNPARDVSTLALTLAEAGTVRIAAYDALGREVAVLHDGPVSETLDLRVDTSAWPVGVYIVRAEAGERTATARLVVAR